MKRERELFDERKLVAALFVVVFVVYSFAQQQSREFEKLYNLKMTGVVSTLVKSLVHFNSTN